MTSYAVTGASRGIGLGFVKKLSERPNSTVFAVVRNKPGATVLQAFADSAPKKNVYVIQGDISNLSSIKAAAAEVSAVTGGKLDVLINNGAKMVYERSFLTLDQFPSDEVLEHDLMDFFKTNVVGITHTTNAFLPLIQAGTTKKIFYLSTGLGSIKYTLDASHSPNVAYSISKAALNMVVTKFALTYKNVLFLAVSPGFVRTFEAPEEVLKSAITVEESVRDQLALFDKVTLEKSGLFVRRDGEDGSLGEFRL